MKKYYSMTFLKLAAGLLISMVCAYLASTMFVLPFEAAVLLFVIQVIMVYILSSRIEKLSDSAGTTLLALFSIIDGLTLSSVFLYYRIDSIVACFFGAFMLFVVIWAAVTFTSIDFSRLSSFVLPALIALIIGEIISIFIPALNPAMTAIGLVIFFGVTAVDFASMQARCPEYDDDERVGQLSTMAALSLYLDFINIFLRLLRLSGKRRD